MASSKFSKIKNKQRAKKITEQNTKQYLSSEQKYKTQMQIDADKHKEALEKAKKEGFYSPEDHSDLKKGYEYFTTHLEKDKNGEERVVVKHWFRPILEFGYKKPEFIVSQQVREKETDPKRIEEIAYEFETKGGLQYPIFTEELAKGSEKEGNVSGHHRRKAWMKKYPDKDIPRFLLGRPRRYAQDGNILEWGNTSVAIDSRTGGHSPSDHKPFGWPDAAIQLSEHYKHDNTMRGWNPDGTRPPRPSEGKRQPFDNILDNFFPEFKDRWNEKVRGKIWKAWIGKTISSVGVVFDIDDAFMQKEMQNHGMPIRIGRGNKKGERLSKIEYSEKEQKVFVFYNDNGKNFEYQVTEDIMERCSNNKKSPYVLLAHIFDPPSDSESLNKKRRTFLNRIQKLNLRLTNKNFAGPQCPIIEEVRFVKQLDIAADNGSNWKWETNKKGEKDFVEV